MTEENLNKLKEISKLEDNWNGYGAKPIPRDVIDNTEKILHACKHKLQIFPTADGEIQLEFEKENGDYLQIDISEKSYFNVFEITSERINGCEGVVERTIDAVLEMVDKFYAN